MEYIILLLVICCISYFAFSPKFSPIPFFPTDKDDLPAILKALHLQNDHIVYDLGAGTGTVIFNAAQEAYEKKLDTIFVAMDINVLLVAILHIRRFFHPNKENIKIVRGDLFKYDYDRETSNFDHVSYYMYVSPWYTGPMAQMIKDTERNAQVISYYYPIKNVLKEKEHIKGCNDIYIYEVPKK